MCTRDNRQLNSQIVVPNFELSRTKLGKTRVCTQAGRERAEGLVLRCVYSTFHIIPSYLESGSRVLLPAPTLFIPVTVWQRGVYIAPCCDADCVLPASSCAVSGGQSMLIELNLSRHRQVSSFRSRPDRIIIRHRETDKKLIAPWFVALFPPPTIKYNQSSH